jgi:outer membrane lipoprotein-sorting protein
MAMKKTTFSPFGFKIFLLFSLLLSFSFSSFAQLDDNSGAIIKGVANKTKSYSTIKISFSFKNTEKGKTVVEKGSIWIKGNKFIFNFNKQLIFCNGVTQWNYIQESNEVSINNADAEQETINPASILNNYEKKYKTKLIKETMEYGKLVQIVDLYPLKASSIGSIRLTIQKNISQIIKMIVVEKGGGIYEYNVTSFIVNQPIDDKNFQFDAKKYPKVEINDMR